MGILILPSATTSQIDNLTNFREGDFIYDSTKKRLTIGIDTDPLNRKELAYLEDVAGLFDLRDNYDATTNTPDLDTSPSGVLKGYAYVVTTAGDFFAEAVEIGDVLISKQDNPTILEHWIRIEKNDVYLTKLEDDLTPKLAGPLDVNGFAIGTGGPIVLNGDTTINGKTSLQGGLQQLVTITSAAAYSVLKTTSLIEFDTTLNNIVATLPAILSDPVDNGRRFTFFRQTSGLNQVTLTPQAPSTIRGEETDIVLGLKSDSLTLLAVGGNWFPIDRNTFAIAALDQLTPGEDQLIPIGTPAVVTAFDTNLFSTNGILISDFTTNSISVIHNESLINGGDGFKIAFRIECDYANNQELVAQIYVNGSPVNIKDVRTSSNAFDTVLEAEGVLRISSAPQTIEVRIIGTSNSLATYQQCTLIVERVGK